MVRPRFSFPLPHDVDAAPQLVTVALMHAALVATGCALDSAHPVLVLTRRPDKGCPRLSDTEHLAQLVILAADELAERLDDYTAALANDGIASDDILPF